MTAIMATVTVLCASLFVCAIIKMIAPSGNTEKIFRLVISIFALICIVICFKSISKEISFKDLYQENSSNIQDESVLKLTGDYMAQYIKKLIISENITPKNVEVSVIKDENSVINLSEIIIYIDQDDIVEERKIIAIVEADLNFTPQIKRSGNEKDR